MSPRLGAVPLLVLAGLLLWLAGPPGLAALTALPGDPWLDRIQAGAAVPPRGLDTIRRSRGRALDWSDAARWRGDRALADLLAAEAADSGPEHAGLLRARAIEDLERALATAPSQAFLWTRLAHARLTNGDGAAAVVPVLAMAYRVAPFNDRLLLPRIGIAFGVWPALDPALRTQVETQIRRAAQGEPARAEALVALARAAGRLDTLRLVLLPELPLLFRIERIIDRTAPAAPG